MHISMKLVTIENELTTMLRPILEAAAIGVTFKDI